MRRIMWFSVGFATACVLCAYLLPSGGSIPLIAIVFALGIAAGLLGRQWDVFRRVACCAVGCAVGLGWFLLFRSNYLMPAIQRDGVTEFAVITATGFAEITDYGMVLEGKVQLEGKSYQVRTYLDEQKDVEPGDTLAGEFRFRVTTPDGEDPISYHQGKGIFLIASQKGDLSHTKSEAVTWKTYPAILRGQIQNLLRECFPEDVFPFVQALLLGNKSELDYETQTNFEISGIAHIVAVSGLHVSILFGVINTLTFKRRYLTALISMPLLLLFAAVAGFTPSVNRACIMIGLMILASVCNREYDSGTALAFACLVMLIINPYVITSVSLQLSAASVAGIILFSGRIHNWMQGFLGTGKGKGALPRLCRWITSSVSVTLSATSLTVPLCAWYFGTVSVIGVVTNLLVLWAVSILFYGIIAVCLVSLLSLSVAKLLAGLFAWLGRYILTVSDICANVPLAAVYTKSIYVVFWVVFLYILLAVFLLSRKKQPCVLICCAVVSLCLVLLLSWTEYQADECRVTVLDVGQGQCILLQSGGQTFLVDCGGDRDTLAADTAAETLLSQGITHVNGMILTHGDLDHSGGVPHLLTRIDTDLLFLPGVADSGTGEALAALTEGQTLWVKDTVQLTAGDTTLTVFGPIYEAESNENSLCVLFETENCAILITGDRSGFGERMLLRMEEVPDVDLLIAGHHGSKYSTCTELLEAVKPETVIISVGENAYGHPAPELLQRLEDFDCTVYRTDEDGTVIYRR